MPGVERQSGKNAPVPDLASISHDPTFVEFATQVLGGSEIAVAPK